MFKYELFSVSFVDLDLGVTKCLYWGVTKCLFFDSGDQ